MGCALAVIGGSPGLLAVWGKCKCESFHGVSASALFLLDKWNKNFPLYLQRKNSANRQQCIYKKKWLPDWTGERHWTCTGWALSSWELAACRKDSFCSCSIWKPHGAGPAGEAELTHRAWVSNSGAWSQKAFFTAARNHALAFTSNEGAIWVSHLPCSCLVS